MSKAHRPFQHQYFMLRDKNTLALLASPDTLTITIVFAINPNLQGVNQISDLRHLPLAILSGPKHAPDTYGMHGTHTPVAWSRSTDLWPDIVIRTGFRGRGRGYGAGDWRQFIVK